MQGYCRFAAVLFCVFLLAPNSSSAKDQSCSGLYPSGIAPKITSDKLSVKTTPLCYSQLSVLYSGVARTPLWSAEHLTAAEIRKAQTLPRLRSTAFHSEPLLPVSDRAELSDYKRSGFDRGHMSPNGDMSTPEAQEESFSLANMVPQHPCNNEVLWEGIESAVRGLANSEGEVYVVTGPAFLGDTVQSLKGRVLVPTHIYKAVYVPSRNVAAAYFAPNDASQTWETLSIAELAERIDIDAFPALAEQVRKNAMTLPQPTPHFGCRLRVSEAPAE